jgi:hypothetical protein
MSDNPQSQINTRKQNKVEAISVRTAAINNTVDEQTKKILDELDEVSSQFDGMLSIMQDRVVQSSDCNFAISYARIAEMRMDTLKKRIDIVKALITDKGNEVAIKKKSTTSELDSILSGAALGIALGAKVTGGNIREMTPFETVDVENAEIVIETEHFGNSVEKSADNIIHGIGE